MENKILYENVKVKGKLIQCILAIVWKREQKEQNNDSNKN